MRPDELSSREDVPAIQRAADLDCKYRFAVPYEQKCCEEAELVYNGVIQQLDGRKSLRVLDLSNGVGEHARELARLMPAHSIHAVTNAEELMNEAKERDRIYKAKMHTRKSVFYILRASPGALASLVQHHRYNIITVMGDRILRFKTISEVEQFLRRCAALLRPYGRLIIQMNEIFAVASDITVQVNLRKNFLHVTTMTAEGMRGEFGRFAQKKEPVRVASDIRSGDKIYYYYSEPIHEMKGRHIYDLTGRLNGIEDINGNPVNVTRGISGHVCAYKDATGLEYRAIGKAYISPWHREDRLETEYTIGFNQGESVVHLINLLERCGFQNCVAQSSGISSDGTYKMIVLSADKAPKIGETIPLETSNIPEMPDEADKGKKKRRSSAPANTESEWRPSNRPGKNHYHNTKHCGSLPGVTFDENEENLEENKPTPDWLHKMYPSIEKTMPAYLVDALNEYRCFVLFQTGISANLVEEATISQLMDNFFISFFVRRNEYYPETIIDNSFDEIDPERKMSEKMKATTARLLLTQIDFLMQRHGLTMEGVKEQVEFQKKKLNGVRYANLYLFPVFLGLIKIGYKPGELSASP